jgi:hypothetical protein
MLIPIILADARKNGNDLRMNEVDRELAALGLPLRAWLLEQNEHLYNCAGFETYEPIFDKDYLERVARAMNVLWCGTVDLQPISYQYLAAELRETNLHRVKTAVRRIAIIGRDRAKASGAANELHNESDRTILCTISGWSWARNGPPLKDILGRIGFLEKPDSFLDFEEPDNSRRDGGQ